MGIAGVKNTFFNNETNSKQKSGMNQMGKEKMNKKMKSTKKKFEPNIMNQNRFSKNNPMMNQSKYENESRKYG